MLYSIPPAVRRSWGNVASRFDEIGLIFALGLVLGVLAGFLMALVIPGAKQESEVFEFANEPQEQAWAYGPHPMCMSGGWGAGKTVLGCVKGIYLSTYYRHNRGVIVRYRSNELKETTMATWYKWCPPSLYAQSKGGRRNDQRGYCRLVEPFGSEILFMHLEDPNTAGIVKGLEINWFLWDQAEENPEAGEELFDMLLARLGRWDLASVPAEELERHAATHGEPWPFTHPKSNKPVPPPYAMLACNPDVETHWLYRRFHPESHEHHAPIGTQPSYKDRGYKLFHMPSQTNRFLGDTNLQILLSQDAAFIRRNVHGLWGQPEGAIHVVDKTSLVEGSALLVEYLKQTCTLYRTMDYGDSSPTCCLWWAVDRSGNVICWQEYYLGNASISTHRANIAGLSDPHDHYDRDLADPSIFHTMPAKKGGRFCVADEFSDVVSEPRHTAIFWKPADNNEMGTRNRINEYLRVDPDRIHPFTKQKGAPRLYFVTRTEDWPQGVVHALQQLRSQRRVKVGTNLGKPVFSDERDDTIVDHAYDCVRYELASRPPAPPPIPLAAQGTFIGVRRLMKKYKVTQGVR